MDRFAYTVLGSGDNSLTMRTLTNELANVSTSGFKKSYSNSLTSFKINGPGFDTRYSPTNVRSDLISLQSGGVSYTNNPMDVAMNDKTVLGVTAPNGDIAFTRRGDLRLDNNGIIVTASGHAVRGQGGGALTAPTGYLLEITEDGTVFATNPSAPSNTAPTRVGRLMLKDASDTKLYRRDDGLYQSSGEDGKAKDFTDGKITPSLTPRSLEGSTVSAVENMVKIIEYQRNFEASIRVIKEAKTLDEAGASMMKSA